MEFSVKNYIYLFLILFITQTLNGQVPNNSTKSLAIQIGLDDVPNKYSYQLDVNINTDNIEDYQFAQNLSLDLNLNKKFYAKELNNGKVVSRYALNIKGAKTLNLVFKDFYLEQDSKLYIYTKDKNQIIGPYTWNENKDRLLTHLIFSNEIIIELNHNKGSKDNIFISDIGIGVRDVSYFTDMIAKEEIKIETEFKKNQTQSSSFCDTVELYRTYCSDLLDTGYTNGIRNLKNANCSQFDLLEKQKRAVCVVITRTTSSSEWWVGKSGILINPVTDTCKAYILTCAHCTGVDTTETYDYAVRFNWLRKECDIPSNMPNCDTDYIPWFNLIDIDEVRDYCSLTLKYAGKPPGLGWFPDLALLEMDDMPTYKEYFNGWRIVYAPSEGYWDYNLGTYKVDADGFYIRS